MIYRIFRDQLQISPKTQLHINMQIAQPHTSLTPPHTLTQLHTHATCTIYVCLHACVYSTCCVDPSDHVVTILSYPHIACRVYRYSNRIIELRHCAYSIHIARYSAACHCTHHTCSCDTWTYTHTHIQTHALDTIALSYEHIHHLSCSLRSWHVSSIS